MLRRTPLRSGNTPLKRTPIARESRKRKAERSTRAAVRAAALARDDYRCTAAAIVPEIACYGPLDADEVKSRGVNPGGHLNPDNVQILCRAHHDWRHDHPAEARRRGLRKASYDN